MGRDKELMPVPGSVANSLPSASLPPIKPSSEARAAAGTRFTFDEEEDVEDMGQMSAAPMDEARPSQVDDIIEDEEPVVAVTSWQPAPTAAGAAASTAAESSNRVRTKSSAEPSSAALSSAGSASLFLAQKPVLMYVTSPA